MGPISADQFPDGALLLLDSPPIIYHLEGRARLADRFAPLFEAHAQGRLVFALSTVGLAEVLTGPLKHGDEILVRRYRSVFETWRVVALDSDIAEYAARLRTIFGLRLADAVHAASALAINAAALVTHDRDFSRIKGLRIIS
jgi:predicted nucleic acid-binding protein